MAPALPEMEAFFAGIRDRVREDKDGSLSGLRKGQKLVLRMSVLGSEVTGYPSSSNKAVCERDMHFWRGAPTVEEAYFVTLAGPARPDSVLEFASIEALRKLGQPGVSPPQMMREGKMRIRGNRMALFSLRGVLMAPRKSDAKRNRDTKGLGWPLKKVLRSEWVPDKNASACMDCKQIFTFFRRRHHCRFCGKIYCNKCLLDNPRCNYDLVCFPCRKLAGEKARETRLSDDEASEEVEGLKRTVKELQETNDKQERLMNKLLITGSSSRIQDALGWWFFPVVLPFIVAAARLILFTKGINWWIWVIMAVLEIMGIYVARLPPDAQTRRSLLVTSLFCKIAFRYKFASLRAKTMPEEFADALWEITHRVTAEEVYQTVLQVKGSYIKLGQSMSGRADVLPPAFTGQLKRLQDSLCGDSKQHVQETIQKEFGRPIEDIFSHFEYEPIASASIAQVHAAVLRSNGKKVAVKLQHKGIKEIMMRDQFVIRRLLWISGIGFPKQKPLFDAIIEFSKKMEPELDFEQEGASQRNACNAIDSAGPELASRVVVPRPIEGLITHRVLVMDYIEAKKMPANDRDPSVTDAQRQDLAESMCAAFAHLMLVKGEFMCDPHPGNFLVQLSRRGTFQPKENKSNLGTGPWKTGSKLVILDFGMSAKLKNEARLGFCELVLSIRDGDTKRMVRAFERIGLRLDEATDQDKDNVMTFMTHFYRDTAPAAENREKFMEYIKEVQKKRAAEEKKGIKHKNGMNIFNAVSVDWLMYNRTYSLLRGACCILGGRVPLLDIFCAAATRGLARNNQQAYLPSAPPPVKEKKSGVCAWMSMLFVVFGVLLAAAGGVGLQMASGRHWMGKAGLEKWMAMVVSA